jgi:hypothetical protein
MEEKLNGLLLQYEAWKTVLQDLESENILFKMRLADILATDIHKKQLKHLEFFQTRFLNMDEQINLLRHEVREGCILPDRPVDTDTQIQLIRDQQKGLATRIAFIQENFHLLRTDFKIYLSDAFP